MRKEAPINIIDQLQKLVVLAQIGFSNPEIGTLRQVWGRALENSGRAFLPHQHKKFTHLPELISRRVLIFSEGAGQKRFLQSNMTALAPYIPTVVSQNPRGPKLTLACLEEKTF